MSAGVIGGVELSFIMPDNWENADTLGTLGFGFTGETGGEVSGSIQRIDCDPLNDPDEDDNNRRRRRKCCPECMPPAPPPGGDHPDDTLSVVMAQATSYGREVEAWQNLARNARYFGYGALAQYADYRVEQTRYLATMEDYPLNQTLASTQLQVVADTVAHRLLKAAELEAMLPLVVEQWRQLTAQGSANVLSNGYYQQTLAMLSDYGVPSRVVGPNFSPQELGQSLLIIPTSGLFGLDNLQGITERLKRFVLDGGTLLVMAQPEDDSLALLPGAGLEQVGYHNDISCFRDAMTMLTYHPMLASRASLAMDSHVDGYLTQIPSAATLLLERTKNNQGALALYPLGEGRMIVTNMYDDWGRTVGQSAREVRYLFRDIIRWAMQPGDLSDTQPGGSIAVSLQVVNRSAEIADSVGYVVRDPNGIRVVFPLTQTQQTLAPGASTTLNPTFDTVNGSLGIWQVNYELYNADGQMIQPETTGALFTLSDPPVLKAPTTASASSAPRSTSVITLSDVALTLDRRSYRPDDTVQATLNISVADLGAGGALRTVVSLGAMTKERVITAQVTQTLAFTLPADFSTNGLLFYGVYGESSGQGLYLNTRWVQQAGEYITMTTDQPQYAPGDTVTLTLDSQISDTLRFRGIGLNREITIQAGTWITHFKLPDPLKRGAYRIRAVGQEVVETRFDVHGPMVRVRALRTPQPLSTVRALLTLAAEIESDATLDVYMLGTFVEPDGDNVRVLEERRTLQAGSQVISWHVPFSVTMSGLSRFELQVFDANDPTVRYVQASRYFETPTPQLLALRVPEIKVALNRPFDLDLDWFSPISRTVTVTLLLSDTALYTHMVPVMAGFDTTRVQVPGITAKGAFDMIALAEVDGLDTAASARVIVEQGPFYVYLPLILRE
jgi:hypothetical protein